MWMTLIGGQSRAFFYGVAQKLGYKIRITEFSPYMCGVSHVGDRTGIYNPDDPTRSYWQLGPREERYAWIVHVDALRYDKFFCGSSMTGRDRLLAIVGPDDLMCVFNRWKPAHTLIVWDFTPWQSLDYTKPLNSMYIPMGLP
jgi:uncharacterized protein YmfQ (DUF2313 family)